MRAFLHIGSRRGAVYDCLGAEEGDLVDLFGNGGRNGIDRIAKEGNALKRFQCVEKNEFVNFLQIGSNRWFSWGRGSWQEVLLHVAMLGHFPIAVGNPVE